MKTATAIPKLQYRRRRPEKSAINEAGLVPKFQPVVRDPDCKLRDRYNLLAAETGVMKEKLAAKIFEIGLSHLEEAKDHFI